MTESSYLSCMDPVLALEGGEADVADSASFISSGVMGCVMWRPSYLRLVVGDLSGVRFTGGCVRYL
jgi:hypothetical protein